MQAIAEELRCSVMQAAEADPQWREMATLKLLAQAEAKRMTALVMPTGLRNG